MRFLVGEVPLYRSRKAAEHRATTIYLCRTLFGLPGLGAGKGEVYQVDSYTPIGEVGRTARALTARSHPEGWIVQAQCHHHLGSVSVCAVISIWRARAVSRSKVDEYVREPSMST